MNAHQAGIPAVRRGALPHVVPGSRIAAKAATKPKRARTGPKQAPGAHEVQPDDSPKDRPPRRTVLIGYAPVSTDKQPTALQFDAPRATGMRRDA